MGVESAADLSDFFSLNEFAIEASSTPSGGSASTINIIFDKPFSSVPLDTGELDIESNSPSAICKGSDVPSVAHGDVLIINSVTYHVVGVQESSGSGYENTTLLILEQQ